MMSYLVFYFLGLGYLWCFFFVAIAGPKHWKKLSLVNSKGALNYTSLGFFLLSLLLTSRSVLAVVFEQNALRTSLGEIYSSLIWLFIGLFIRKLSLMNSSELLGILKGFYDLAKIQGIISLVAVLIHPSPISVFQTPLGFLNPDTGSSSSWSTLSLAYSGWFGGEVIRSSGIMASAAWSAYFGMVVIFIRVFFNKQLRDIVKYKFLDKIFFILLLVSQFTFYTRIPILLLLTALFYERFRNSHILIKVVSYSTALCFFLLIFLLSSAFERAQVFSSKLIILRRGSSSIRINSWNALRDILGDSDVTTRISGLGVKPKIFGENNFGLGSEGTFFSLLVRGGLISLVIFLLILMILTVKVARNNEISPLTFLVFSVFPIFFVDYDGGHLYFFGLVTLTAISSHAQLNMNADIVNDKKDFNNLSV
jgi:hypothetical protein